MVARMETAGAIGEGEVRRAQAVKPDRCTAALSESMPQASPRVIFIGGVGRTGSTLLERLVGQLPGTCSIGELVYMWDRGVAGGNRCGCGEPFRQCSFWHRVVTTAFGSWDAADRDVARVAELRSAVDRTRFIPWLVAPDLRPRFRRLLDEYLEYVHRVYAAVGSVSGCRVVVDSSKNASFAFCLRSCAELDLRVIHLVRDSRAVAYSWTRRVLRPEAPAPRYMHTVAPPRTALRWNYQNGALQLLAGIGTPTLRVRYEDLALSPELTLARIGAFTDLPVDSEQLGFVGHDERGPWADLGAAHSASGNPFRFTTGRIPIRLDDEWRTAMPTAQRRAVTALTLPLLARYGYLRDEVGRHGPQLGRVQH